MRFDAAALVADQFRFEDVAKNGERDHVTLGKSGGVTGFYEYSGAHIVDAKAVLFEVVSALWHLEGGHVAATKPSRLDGVALDLRVPLDDAATTMHLELATGTLGGFAYVDGDLVVEGAATLGGVTVDLAADGKLTVRAVDVSLRDVRVISGATTVAIAEARIEGLNVVRLGDSLEVTARRADLVGTVIDHSFAQTPAPGVNVIPDVPALDLIEGTVALDVKVTADVPVLTDKTISQKLRIPIIAGAMSYADLEHGLPILGDALFDFEVRGDELILELDIVPVVKLDNVTLVSWSLADSVDRDLAKQKRVRLRRLLQARTPPAEPATTSKKNAFRLLGVDLADIDVALGLTGPTDVALGGGTVRVDSVGALEVSGALHVAVDGAPAPGRLDASVGAIAATWTNVDVGPVSIARATLTIGTVDPVRAEFTDLSPTSVRATIRDATITDLALGS